MQSQKSKKTKFQTEIVIEATAHRSTLLIALLLHLAIAGFAKASSANCGLSFKSALEIPTTSGGASHQVHLSDGVTEFRYKAADLLNQLVSKGSSADDIDWSSLPTTEFFTDFNRYYEAALGRSWQSYGASIERGISVGATRSMRRSSIRWNVFISELHSALQAFPNAEVFKASITFADSEISVLSASGRIGNFEFSFFLHPWGIHEDLSSFDPKLVRLRQIGDGSALEPYWVFRFQNALTLRALSITENDPAHTGHSTSGLSTPRSIEHDQKRRAAVHQLKSLERLLDRLDGATSTTQQHRSTQNLLVHFASLRSGTSKEGIGFNQILNRATAVFESYDLDSRPVKNAIEFLAQDPETILTLDRYVSALERTKWIDLFILRIKKAVRTATKRRQPVVLQIPHLEDTLDRAHRLRLGLGAKLTREGLIGKSMQELEKDFAVLARKTSPEYTVYQAISYRWQSVWNEVDLALTPDYFGIPNEMIGTDAEGRSVNRPLGAKFFALTWRDAVNFNGRLLNRTTEHRYYAILFEKDFINRFAEKDAYLQLQKPARFPAIDNRAVLASNPNKLFVISLDGPRKQVTVLTDRQRMLINGCEMTHAGILREMALAVVEFDSRGQVINAITR